MSDVPDEQFDSEAILQKIKNASAQIGFYTKKVEEALREIKEQRKRINIAMGDLEKRKGKKS